MAMTKNQRADIQTSSTGFCNVRWGEFKIGFCETDDYTFVVKLRRKGLSFTGIYKQVLPTSSKFSFSVVSNP